MPTHQSFRFEDSKSPKSRPIETLQDADEWAPSSADVWNISTVYCNSDNSSKNAKRVKLLICHDMANGYKEDELVQGNGCEKIWSCQTWHFVDIFVYFSHHRITIPPVNFTNACHRNGVLALGTFIVEWQEGVSELEKFLLRKPSKAGFDEDHPIPDLWNPHYADILVDIAEQYKFDGWLINIESPFASSPLPREYKAQQMVKLLKYLTDNIHQRIANSKILWYDSMTKEGDVNWQNTLNDMNKEFYMATDGIFVNYCWKADTPKAAYEVAKGLGREGNNVFLGNDVWGRGSFASGFDTWKGIQEASKCNLSSAIFGPAWTYEYLGPDNFQENDNLLWHGGMPSQYPLLGQNELISIEAGPNAAEIMESRRFGISDVVTPRPASTTKRFATCFDRGYGHIFNIAGEIQMLEPWSHLSHQSIQPNIIPSRGKVYYEMSANHAYLGGTSLGVFVNEAFAETSQDWSTEMVPMYSLDMPLSNYCRIRYSVKDIAKNISFGVYVRITRPEGTARRFVMVPNSDDTPSDCYFIIENEIGHGASANPVIIRPSVCETQTENKWITRTRIFKFSGDDKPDWKVTELGVVLHKPRSLQIPAGLVAWLGSVSINNDSSVPPSLEFPQIHMKDRSIQKIADIPAAVAANRIFFCTLEWNIKFLDNHTASCTATYKIWDHLYFFAIYYRHANSMAMEAHPRFKPHRWMFLGTAFTCAYRVSGIRQQAIPTTLEFEVRAIDHFGKQLAKPAYLEITL